MWANIAVVTAVGLVVFFTIRSAYKNHKSGTSSCSCGLNCSHCGGACHADKKSK